MSTPATIPPDIDDKLERKNVENILLKQQAGKVLTDAERQQVADWAERQRTQETVSKQGVSRIAGDPARRINPRKRHFAELVASGLSQSEAYRRAYKHPKIASKKAATASSRIAGDPAVRALIEDLRRRSAGKTILSLNDRLGLLASTAQRPVRNAADANAQARVIEVYSKISGDQAPERQDVVVRGDPAAPLQTVHRPATKAEKIEALLALRKRRQATQEPASPPTP